MTGSILVYSMGEILGDGVWKLPALGALRAAFPHARLAWAAAHPQGTVYAGALARAAGPLIDEIVTGPGAGAAARDLLTAWAPFGGRRFDLVIDTQTRLGPALVARRAGRRMISAAAGFALSAVRPAGPWPAAARDQALALFGLAAGRTLAPAPPPLVTPAAAAEARRLLPDGAVYVGFAPGAGGAIKRWPLDRFLAVAAQAEAAGARPVFFLGPDEQAMIAPIRAARPSALLPEQEPAAVRGPDLVFALAGRLRAALANDSGTGHMLGLAGAPLVTLFRTRRLAAKFPTWSPRPVALAADDHGRAGDIAAIGAAAAGEALLRLMREAA